MTYREDDIAEAHKVVKLKAQNYRGYLNHAEEDLAKQEIIYGKKGIYEITGIEYIESALSFKREVIRNQNMAKKDAKNKAQQD